MGADIVVADHGGEGSLNGLILLLVLGGIAALLTTILVAQHRDPDRVRHMELRRALLGCALPRSEEGH